MSQVKIQIKVGDVEFSGEGEQGWVSTQLERILKAAPGIVGAKPGGPSRPAGGHDDGQSSVAGSQTLASFLRDKNASTNILGDSSVAARAGKEATQYCGCDSGFEGQQPDETRESGRLFEQKRCKGSLRKGWQRLLRHDGR